MFHEYNLLNALSLVAASATVLRASSQPAQPFSTVSATVLPSFVWACCLFC